VLFRSEWASENGFNWHEAFGAGTRTVYVFGKALSDFLKVEFGNGAYEKKIPGWVMTLPHEKQMYILESYFRGDGVLFDKTRPALTASTRSRSLAMQVQILLVRIGYGTTINVSIDHEELMYRMNISGAFGQRLADAWALPMGRKSRKYNHMRMSEDFVFYPVKEVRSVPYAGDVCNFEVAGSNTYCVPVVVHNCEKDALSGVLRPLAREFHVTMMVNIGYSSQSAMYDSASRFMAASDAGKECKLFYLGDHDPSGEDMVRDIRDRLEMFGATVEVEKIGLTMAQVERYNPPPNPAKLTDPRSAEYVDKHGAVSWEVDALPPEVLNRLVRGSITEIVDGKKMDEIKRREEADKRRLLAAVREIVGEKKS
jgi:hypothetical protein